jgi:hypothetical protein
MEGNTKVNLAWLSEMDGIGGLANLQESLAKDM